MTMDRNLSCLAIFVAATVCLCLPGCDNRQDQPAAPSDTIAGDLVIFQAGSLAVPLREVSEQFMKEHPKVVVKAEAAGSRDCARKISDLGRECDVMASADYTVISDLLMPEYADFNIRFATNEMAIAYTKSSKRGEEIDAENWPAILLSDGVAFGRADPDRDPCGYRTVMVMQLAETHYSVPGLAEKLVRKDGMRYVRPKETELLSLLEAGEIDYLFIYRSVAEQHKLKMVLLPDEVNLKSEELAPLYAKATVELTGKRPGETITKRGAPMVYGVTIPKNAPNRKAAEAYVAWLLSDKGKAVMQRAGQPSPRPCRTDGLEHLPECLEPFCCR